MRICYLHLSYILVILFLNETQMLLIIICSENTRPPKEAMLELWTCIMSLMKLKNQMVISLLFLVTGHISMSNLALF